jgi:hypothetical protein
MPIPTTAWWRKKTSSVYADRKNPLITDIDILLTEYHSTAKTDVQKQKILVLILFYCTTWLVTKGEKKGSWRRKYVQELEDQVEAELRSTEMLNAAGQRVGGTAGVHLKEDPIELLQPRDARGKFGLQAGLNYDRLSASNAEDFSTKFGKSNKLTGYSKELQGEMNSGTGAHDYVDSLRIIAAGKAGGAKIGSNLAYLSKQERLRHLLALWPDNCFHLCGRDTAYQTASPDYNDIFAMDQMEFIYVGDPKAGKFHHSTFLSGKPVLCAGEIQVRGGKITYISNESGHYRPSTRDLMACVGILQRKYNCDLTRMKVADLETKHDWNSASDFVARAGTPPRAGRVIRAQGAGGGQ